MSTENPCAAYPGYVPTDTTGDGNVDQCIVNPGSFGYVRCGAFETEDGELLDQYCNPALTGDGEGSPPGVQCGPGARPVDLDGDRIADTCVPDPSQQQSNLCQPGYAPLDTNGDGRPDICQFIGQPTPVPDDNPCPPGFPYGRDTNNDGNIDTCFATP